MKPLLYLLHNIRIRFYRKIWSKSVTIKGNPVLNQPLMINGSGKIMFAENVNIGYRYSQQYLNTYTYFDLRGTGASIKIGKNVILNNNTSLNADKSSITIGNDTVAGVNLSIMTSDGHNIEGSDRHDANYPGMPVVIGENVFIGDNVLILKGVNIGKNSVIGAGSVVTKDIPENAIVAGNPCKILRLINQD